MSPKRTGAAAAAEMMPAHLDETDKAIIRALRADPLTPNSGLAAIVGASEMTIARRLKRLVNDRLIKVTVQRDMRPLGFSLVAFADIHVEGVPVQAVGDALADVPEAYSVSYMVGHPQIVVMIMARSNAHLFEIVNTRVAPIEGVKHTDTSVVLHMFNHRTGIAAL